MSDYDSEKHPIEKISSASSIRESIKDVDGTYTREELVDPNAEETLHRSLSARQISMIAVCVLLAMVKLFPLDSS